MNVEPLTKAELEALLQRFKWKVTGTGNGGKLTIYDPPKTPKRGFRRRYFSAWLPNSEEFTDYDDLLLVAADRFDEWLRYREGVPGVWSRLRALMGEG